MAIAEVDIVNSALRDVAGTAITAIDDTTPSGEVANDVYTLVRDDLLRAHNWNFAIERTTLAAFHHPAPTHGFSRAYILPDGVGSQAQCMRVVEVDDGYSAYRLEKLRVLHARNGDLANLLSNADDFSGSAWSTTNTLSVTANAVAGPEGSDPADTLSDTDASNASYRYQAVTVANSDQYIFVAVKVKASTSTYATLQAKLTGGTTTITVYNELKFSDATVTKGGAQQGRLHSYGVEALDSSFYWVWLAVRNNSTGNTTLTVEIYPTGLANQAGSATGALYAVTAWAEVIDPLPITYVRKVTDPDEMSPDFRELLSLALAVKFASPVAESGGLHERLENKFNRRLRRVKGVDGNEDFPQQFPEGSWASVRNSSGGW